MIAKNFAVALLGFLLLQIFNVGVNADNQEDAEPVCKIGEQLKPFVPMAHDVAKRTSASADDAVPLSEQLMKTCEDIKNGKATQEEKSALAKRLRAFGDNSNSIMKDMRNMVNGGQQLIDNFFVEADKLDGKQSS